MDFEMDISFLLFLGFAFLQQIELSLEILDLDLDTERRKELSLCNSDLLRERLLLF
ncbi:MAG: hypothetical protein KDD45_11395 [Bdellovibrionales bacterium]|nr:hypothetical protein [Bdellovibrionales bacterium]